MAIGFAVSDLINASITLFIVAVGIWRLTSGAMLRPDIYHAAGRRTILTVHLGGKRGNGPLNLDMPGREALATSK